MSAGMCGWWYAQDAKHDYPFERFIYISSTKGDRNMEKKGREMPCPKCFQFFPSKIFRACWNGEKYKPINFVRFVFMTISNVSGLVSQCKSEKKVASEHFFWKITMVSNPVCSSYSFGKRTLILHLVTATKDFSHHTNGLWYGILWRHRYTRWVISSDGHGNSFYFCNLFFFFHFFSFMFHFIIRQTFNSTNKMFRSTNLHTTLVDV